MKIAAAAVAAALLAFGRAGAEETVRLRGGGQASGEVRGAGERMSVVWPFGSVSFEAAQALRDPPSAPETSPPPPGLKGLTEGLFSVRYRLVSRDGEVRAESVRVAIRNNTRLFAPPAESLVEHETVHRAINAAAARRIQARLSEFRYSPRDGRPSLRIAERLFRKNFEALLEEVRSLHRDWDATQGKESPF